MAPMLDDETLAPSTPATLPSGAGPDLREALRRVEGMLAWLKDHLIQSDDTPLRRYETSLAQTGSVRQAPDPEPAAPSGGMTADRLAQAAGRSPTQYQQGNPGGPPAVDLDALAKKYGAYVTTEPSPPPAPAPRPPAAPPAPAIDLDALAAKYGGVVTDRPLPSEAGGTTDPASVRVTQPQGVYPDINQKTGQPSTPIPFGQIPGLDAGLITRGVKALYTPPSERDPNAPQPTLDQIALDVESGRTPLNDAQMDGVSDILSGLMELGTPIFATALIATPVKTLAVWAFQKVIGRGAAEAVKDLGGSPSAQRLADTVTGAVAAGVITSKEVARWTAEGTRVALDAITEGKIGEALGGTARAAIIAAQLSGRAVGRSGAGEFLDKISRPGIHAPIDMIDTGVANVIRRGVHAEDGRIDPAQYAADLAQAWQAAEALTQAEPGSAPALEAAGTLRRFGVDPSQILRDLGQDPVVWLTPKGELPLNPLDTPRPDPNLPLQPTHNPPMDPALRAELEQYARATGDDALLKVLAEDDTPLQPPTPAYGTAQVEDLPIVPTRFEEQLPHPLPTPPSPVEPLPNAVARIAALEKRITEAREQGKPEDTAAVRELQDLRDRMPVVEVTPPATAEPHTYSSTQVDLPVETAIAVRQFAATIPSSDLAEDGREPDPHVTVKYGLHTVDAKKVEALLADEPPITLTLGKTSVFPAGEGRTRDVLKVDVDSPDLHRLNAKIAAALDHTDSYPEYQPHATIAYLKPGAGEKYAGSDALAGHEVTIDRVTFSTKDGRVFEIKLGGAPPAAAGPSLPNPEGQPPPITPTTPETRAILDAIASTGKRDAIVIAGGQRLRVQQSDYGMFGRAIGGDIRLADGSEISVDLVERVEDAHGRVLWRRRPADVTLKGPADEGTQTPTPPPDAGAGPVAPSGGDERAAPAGDGAQSPGVNPSGAARPTTEEEAADAGVPRTPAERESDVIDDLIDAAQRGGFTGDPDVLRSELRDRLSLIKEINAEFDHSGHNPEALLRAIAGYGGLSVGAETGLKGELKWLKEFRDQLPSRSRKNLLAPPRTADSMRGIRGVFRESGLTVDGMVEALRQEPRFNHIETVNDLLEEIRRAAMADPERSAAEQLIKGLGANWWERIGGALPITDDGDISFDPATLEAQPLPPAGDTLDTGEVQPRLPEAGAARDVENPTPTIDAPFSLESEVDTTRREFEQDLFKLRTEEPGSGYSRARPFTGRWDRLTRVPPDWKPAPRASAEAPPPAEQQGDLLPATDDLRPPDVVREDVPRYERRPDTDLADSTARARAVVGDVERAAVEAVSLVRDDRPPYVRPPAGVRLVALGITPDLASTARLDLRGHVVSSAHDIASLAQVARDPRVETFRIIYITQRADGRQEVVATEALSSRLPDSSATFVSSPTLRRFTKTMNAAHGTNMLLWPGREVDTYLRLYKEAMVRSLFHQRARMRRLGATHYYLVHNHPSGNATPSSADRELTAQYARELPGMLGHVVIDSGEYALIDLDGTWYQKHQIANDARLLAAKVPHEVIGQPVESAEQAREIASRLTQPGGVTLLFISLRAKVEAARGIVRAVETVPLHMLRSTEFAGFLKNRKAAYGSASVIAYGDDAGLYELALPLYKQGHLYDVITSSRIASEQVRALKLVPAPVTHRVGEEPPAIRRTVTPDELDALAARRGTSATYEQTRAERAGYTVQVTMVPGAQEFLEHDVLPALKDAAQTFNQARLDIKSLFAPTDATTAARDFSHIVRAHISARDQRLERARRVTAKFAKMFDRQLAHAKTPAEKAAVLLSLADPMETGKTEDLSPELAQAAQLLGQLLASRRREIQRLGRLQNYILHYFPHEWEEKSVTEGALRRLFGKRPLEGPKSFLKQRTIPTTRAGIEAKLVPVSYNPVDLVLRKLYEMDKFIAATHILHDGARQKLAKYIPVGYAAPRGWARFDHSFAIVYGKPSVVFTEGVDKRLMAGLRAFLDDLGVKHSREVNIGGKRWGYAMADAKVVTKFGGPETVLEHELGHILDYRFGLWARIVSPPGQETVTITRGKRKGEVVRRTAKQNKATIARRKQIHAELRALADLRFEGMEASPHFKQYTHNRYEKMANLVHAYLYNPERTREVAPITYGVLESLVKGTPDLAPLKTLQASRSLVLGTDSREVTIEGLLIKGYYYGPREVVTLLDNHLSPGLRGSATFNLYRRTGNFMNALQLGLSLYHLSMTSLESVISKQTLALELVMDGRFKEAMLTQLQVPIAPLVDVVHGHKLLRQFYEKEANARVFDGIMDTVIQGGGGFGWSLFEHDDAGHHFMQALRQGNYPGAGVRAIPALVELMIKPIMEYWVPRLKIAAFYDLMQYELPTLGAEPNLVELRRVAAGAWDSIDNRFGQLRYDNLFWHATLKDLGMASVRALGWNIGSVREAFGAPGAQLRQLGLLKGAGAGGEGGGGKRPVRLVYIGEDGEGNPTYAPVKEKLLHRKTAWLIATVFIYGLYGAIYQVLHTGQRPKELKDYFFPHNGDGDTRVSLPGYPKDWYAFGRDLPGSAGETARHKMHPLLSLLIEVLYYNEDYFGTQIRTPDDPYLDQVADVLRHTAAGYVPIGVRSFQERKKNEALAGRSTSVNAVETFLGITNAPAYVNRTAAETLLKKLRPPQSRTQQQAHQAELRRAIRAGLKAQSPEGTAQAQTAARSGELSRAQIRNVVKTVRFSSLQAGVRTLALPQALQVYEAATPDERTTLRGIVIRKAQRIHEAPPQQRAWLKARAEKILALPFTPRSPVAASEAAVGE